MSHDHKMSGDKPDKDVLLMKKARSVIDAVLALNSLDPDDDMSASRASNNDETRNQQIHDVASSAKLPSTLYWLADDLDDINGLTFPQKMHHVLRNGADDEAIAWLPSGRSFVVRDQKKFATQVIPKYFGKNVAYTSFTRRLVRWGWQNIAKGTYFCKNFNREHPEQCLLMTYNAKVSNKSAAANNSSDVPVAEELEAVAALMKNSRKVTQKESAEPSAPPLKKRRMSETLANKVAASTSVAEQTQSNLEQQQQLLAQSQQQQLFARAQQIANAQSHLPLNSLFPSMSLFHNRAMNASAVAAFNASRNNAAPVISNTMLDAAQRALSGQGEMMTPLKLELLKKQIEIDELKRKAVLEELHMRKALDAAIQAQRSMGQLPQANLAQGGQLQNKPNNPNQSASFTDNARAA